MTTVTVVQLNHSSKTFDLWPDICMLNITSECLKAVKCSILASLFQPSSSKPWRFWKCIKTCSGKKNGEHGK